MRAILIGVAILFVGCEPPATAGDSGGPGPVYDAGPGNDAATSPDGARLDSSAHDVRLPDAHTVDAAASDATTTDAMPTDAAGIDAAASDAPSADAVGHDAPALDSHAGDAAANDRSGGDVGNHDSAPIDIGHGDSDSGDAGAPDGAAFDGEGLDVAEQDAGPGDSGVDAGGQDPCAAPIAIGPGTVHGTTSGESVLDTVYGDSNCWYASGPERVYRYQLDHVADLVWSTDANNFDSVTYIRSDCDGVDPGGAPVPDDHCDDAAQYETEIAVWRAAAPGTYYLVVDGYDVDSAGSFAATLTVREIAGPGEHCDDITARCQDGYVCSPSSLSCVTPDAYCSEIARPLTLGTPASGDTALTGDQFSCNGAGLSSDELWQFTALAAGTYNIHVTATGGQTVFVYTTTDCTDPALSANCDNDPSADFNFDVTAGSGEIVYLVVDGEWGESGPYAITAGLVVVRSPGDPCNPSTPLLDRCPVGQYCRGSGASGTCTDFATMTELEPNDAIGTANAVAEFPMLVGGAIATAGDVDYYAVTTTAGGTLFAETLDGATSLCDTNDLDSWLELFDSAGNSLTTDDDSGSGYCSWIGELVGADTYYVAVSASAFGSNPTFDYTLRLSFIR